MATTLSRWDPFTELNTMRNMMDRFFDQSFGRLPALRRDGEELGPATLGLDVYETGTDIVVKAAVPGVDPQQIDISVEDDVLSIKGEFEQREVGGRRTRDHVARVLHVARRVGDDELPTRGGEVAVRDVDRDALLALGAQAVGEKRQVGVVEAAVAARAFDRLELVLEDLLRLEQEPPDERALPVVDGPRGGKSQQFHDRGPRNIPRACGLPSPLR